MLLWRCLPAVKVCVGNFQHLLDRLVPFVYGTRVRRDFWDLHRLISTDLAVSGHSSRNNIPGKISPRGASCIARSPPASSCNYHTLSRGCTSLSAQRLGQVCDAQLGVSSCKMASTSAYVTEPEGSVADLGRRDLQARSQLREVFLTAVRSGMPQQMLEKVLKYDPTTSTLTVEGRSYHANRNIFVVGFGKAVLGMARVVDDVLGDHIIRGIVSIPSGSRADLKANGHRDMLLSPESKIRVQEGANHNLPDEEAFRAARDIHQLVSNLTEKDIVLVLMSGGGSALLPYPVEPLTLDDLLQVTRGLFSHGASISDVNTVRLHLELLKGGGLAREAKPARVLSFIISDVIGDSLEMIASGPTVRQPRSPHRCLEIIDRLQARGSLPRVVVEVLETKKNQIMAQASLSWSATRDTARAGGIIEEDDSAEWDRVQNVLVGTNAIACQAAAQRAQELGFVPYILTTELSGEAREVGVLFAKLAQYIVACFSPRLPQTTNPGLVQLEMEIARLGVPKSKLNEVADKVLVASNHSKPLCVVAGGETVVNLRGKGKGGRNQEMVLSAGLQLQQCFQTLRNRKEPMEVLFLSAGTDGQDGPTSAAGALVDENFVLDAVTQGLDPAASLQENDSHTLWSRFSGGRDLLVTGLTGTNVMDIQLLLVHTHRAGNV